jgi:hypothetical protein
VIDYRTRKELEVYVSKNKCPVLPSEFSFTVGGPKRKKNVPADDVTALGHELVSETSRGLPSGWKKVVSRAHLNNGTRPLRISYVAPDGSRFW